MGLTVDINVILHDEKPRVRDAGVDMAEFNAVRSRHMGVFDKVRAKANQIFDKTGASPAYHRVMAIFDPYQTLLNRLPKVRTPEDLSRIKVKLEQLEQSFRSLNV